MTNRERAIRVHEDIINCAPGCTEAIIERALTAAVSDVQARLDEERKAHAETRAALEAAKKLADMVCDAACCEGADAKWTAETKAAIVDYKAALAASGARKGGD